VRSLPTQAKAIERAREIGPKQRFVERVRDTKRLAKRGQGGEKSNFRSSFAHTARVDCHRVSALRHDYGCFSLAGF